METKYSLEELINHVEESIKNADNLTSKINSDILNLEGMSGNKTRHLYNNICSLDGANYLEIGVWKGSSFISALYKNNINAIACDNWSTNEGPKNEFFDNVKRLVGEVDFSFIEKDSFSITKTDFPEHIDKIDIYLYDGCHTYDCQKAGVTHFYDFLSKYFILMVDDWNSTGAWREVIDGTLEGIKEKQIIVHKHYSKEPTGGSEYWNGIGIFICEKI
jgi:hypothetical protein